MQIKTNRLDRLLAQANRLQANPVAYCVHAMLVKGGAYYAT